MLISSVGLSLRRAVAACRCVSKSALDAEANQLASLQKGQTCPVWHRISLLLKAKTFLTLFANRLGFTRALKLSVGSDSSTLQTVLVFFPAFLNSSRINSSLGSSFSFFYFPWYTCTRIYCREVNCYKRGRKNGEKSPVLIWMRRWFDESDAIEQTMLCFSFIFAILFSWEAEGVVKNWSNSKYSPLRWPSHFQPFFY